MRGDFRIHDWLVQPQLNLIVGGGKSVHIEPKAMHVLVCLSEHREEVVSKKLLKNSVWPDTYVTDDVLTRSISELRKALGDDSKNPQIIQTIPRGGYRLIAPVQQCGHSDEPEVHPRPEVKLPLRASEPAPASRRFLWLGIAGMGLVAFLFWAFGGLADALPKWTVASQIRSLAVLPLRNISADPEQAYFADAMTEALINDLASLNLLQVTSRTSAMRYRGTTLPVSEIAKQLKVDAIVEGSVMPVDRRIRITVQLIDGRSDRHIWSADYEREFSDILSLQKEVARAVASEIRLKLTPRQERHLTQAQPVAPDAYQAYVKGRYFWNQRSGESLEKAVGYFEDAARHAPHFALAYSGLADTYSLLAHYGLRPADDAFLKAKTAARKALELDSGCAEAHASLALASMSYDRDWPAALRSFRRALELNPGYATAHHWHALCLLGLGRTDEALREAERARDLDPVSLVRNTFLAQCLLLTQRYDEAVRQCLDTLELYPADSTARFILAETYWRQGNTQKAIAELERLKDSSGADRPRILASLWVISGDRQRATQIIDQLAATEGDRSAAFCAEIYALLGQSEKAFHWLDRAYLRHDAGLLLLKVNPSFNSLRLDARFDELLRRIGVGAPA